jgi:hypothetical protein
LIVLAVERALAAQKGKRKNLTKAIQDVSDTLTIDGKRITIPAATIRRIYYSKPDPEWQRLIKLTLALRALWSKTPQSLLPFLEQT